jgi:hypothetical protein
MDDKKLGRSVCRRMNTLMKIGSRINEMIKNPHSDEVLCKLLSEELQIYNDLKVIKYSDAHMNELHKDFIKSYEVILNRNESLSK